MDHLWQINLGYLLNYGLVILGPNFHSHYLLNQDLWDLVQCFVWAPRILCWTLNSPPPEEFADVRMKSVQAPGDVKEAYYLPSTQQKESPRRRPQVRSRGKQQPSRESVLGPASGCRVGWGGCGAWVRSLKDLNFPLVLKNEWHMWVL